MTFEADTGEGLVVIRADGTIDTRSSFEFEETFEQALQANPRCIVVDCSKTQLFTSAGIRVLLAFAKRINQKGGELVLMRPSEHVATVLQISGLGSMFPCVDSVDAAASRMGTGKRPSRISILAMELLSGATPSSAHSNPSPEPRTALGSAVAQLLSTSPAPARGLDAPAAKAETE